MIRTFKSVVRDIVTEKDGLSFDVTKVMWVMGTLVFFAATFWGLYKGQAWEPVNWGIGFGSVLAAGSIGVKIKESTEQSVTKIE